MAVIIGSSILILTLYVFTSNAVNDFMRLQSESLARSKVTDGTFRISRVIRGLNHIEYAQADTITAYSYFAPHDEFTSKIVYYLNSNEDQLLAEVTPMTADYPIGNLILDQQKTVVIIDGFSKVSGSGSDTFEYYDKDHNPLTSPVLDTSPIKNIAVNIHARKYKTNSDKYVSGKVSVNLRNKR